MLLRPLTARIVVIQWGNYNETFNNNLKKSWHLNMLWFRWLFLAEALLDSTWERPGQPSNHCYVWSTCELIIEVLKCKVSLLRITNMPLTSWDLRFFRETKSHFLSSMFFFFAICSLSTQSYLTRTWRPFLLTLETWRINICLFTLTMLVLVS